MNIPDTATSSLSRLLTLYLTKMTAVSLVSPCPLLTAADSLHNQCPNYVLVTIKLCPVAMATPSSPQLVKNFCHLFQKYLSV